MGPTTERRRSAQSCPPAPRRRLQVPVGTTTPAPVPAPPLDLQRCNVLSTCAARAATAAPSPPRTLAARPRSRSLRRRSLHTVGDTPRAHAHPTRTRAHARESVAEVQKRGGPGKGAPGIVDVARRGDPFQAARGRRRDDARCAACAKCQPLMPHFSVPPESGRPRAAGAGNEGGGGRSLIRAVRPVYKCPSSAPFRLPSDSGALIVPSWWALKVPWWKGARCERLGTSESAPENRPIRG